MMVRAILATLANHWVTKAEPQSLFGDLGGDGDLDALSAGKRRATLWLNNGQGRFTQADQSFPCSERQDLTTGDFDGDGQADIFIAGYDKSSQVWFNDGQGGFFLQ